MKQDKIKLIIKCIVVLIVVGLFSFGTYKLIKYTTYIETTSGTLSEIEDGVYLQTYNVYSNIPANNTSVAIVCINNQILTIEGHINIQYTDDTPSYTYNRTRVVNGDTLTVYIPRGTIQRLPNATSK